MVQNEVRDEKPSEGCISAELTYIVRQKEKPYFESSLSTGGEPKVFFKTENALRPLIVCALMPLDFQLTSTDLS